MKLPTLTGFALCMFAASIAGAQSLSPVERLPAEILDITPPSARVSGEPGQMRIIERSCRQHPVTEVRRRIVDTAVQEWGYFGFSVDDMTNLEPPVPGAGRPRRGRTPIDPAEAARVAASIGGYWAAAPDSSWILARQNTSWQTRGLSSRWRDPWSAAFISWVMCESGLGNAGQFARAIAHHTYIDQAILARDGNDKLAVFAAHDPGEAQIIPGDLLCRGTRPAYRTIAQRRAQLGEGARSHCDIVVKIDDDNGRILVIGGNVRGSVRLKLLPASHNDSGIFAPLPYGDRSIFAHLKLAAAPIELNALDSTPTMQSAGIQGLQPLLSMK